MPRLALIATGGTIAGTGQPDRYTAGVLDVSALFAATPGLETLASWQAEQLLSLDSRDMLPAHWLQLAAHIRACMADPSIHGIVVTHGTDTLEETAFALHLLLPLCKPVVLTAAMRPASAANADGPANLLDAARVALHPAAQGVLVVAHGAIIAGCRLIKAHTRALNALRARTDDATQGYISAVDIRLPPLPTDVAAFFMNLDAAAPLPRVDILYGYAGCATDLVDHSVASGARGLVLALTGHGSIPAVWREPLRRASTQGVCIVRATRVAEGGVQNGCNEDDLATGCMAAGLLSPQQARVLTILALAAGTPSDALQALFQNA